MHDCTHYPEDSMILRDVMLLYSDLIPFCETIIFMGLTFVKMAFISFLKIENFYYDFWDITSSFDGDRLKDMHEKKNQSVEAERTDEAAGGREKITCGT